MPTAKDEAAHCIQSIQVCLRMKTLISLVHWMLSPAFCWRFRDTCPLLLRTASVPAAPRGTVSRALLPCFFGFHLLFHLALEDFGLLLRTQVAELACITVATRISLEGKIQASLQVPISCDTIWISTDLVGDCKSNDSAELDLPTDSTTLAVSNESRS
eukprot:TRINITY_DN14102_c0_g1_i5.p1 TRINITY_DN14102_c0_g1~~TRINITY_DN14102_c0_g1_i5.p1  ORF type:complete len:171 (-),score=17.34 TRINITY_DN14102_c0_g1_i5:90-563(-)